MSGIASAIAPVTRFQVANVPLGKGAALAVGMGVGDAVRGIVKGIVRRQNMAGGLSGQMLDLGVAFGAAWVATNVKPIKNALGPELSQLLAIGIVADAINDSFRVQERTASAVGKLFGGDIVSKSPPEFVRRAAPTRVPSGAPGRTDVYAAALGG